MTARHPAAAAARAKAADEKSDSSKLESGAVQIESLTAPTATLAMALP